MNNHHEKLWHGINIKKEESILDICSSEKVHQAQLLGVLPSVHKALGSIPNTT